MKSILIRPVVLGVLLSGPLARAADDEKKEEKKEETFVSISPDKKFAMRIAYDPTFVEGEQIPGTAIDSMTLVTWPEKKFLVRLLPEDEGGLNFEWSELLWSADSRWFAFHYSFPRFGYTLVFRRDGDTFKLATDPEGLSAPVKGDIRNQYVEPQRWVKPGTLIAGQTTIFRGDDQQNGGSTDFTATWDAKAKKFRIKNLKE